MRLYQQLILFMLAATVLPLAILGFWLLSRSESTLVARIGEEQRTVAQAVADASTQRLTLAVDAVERASQLFDWARASPEEVEGGLKLLYQQSALVSATLLVAADGQVVAGPVYLTQPMEGHPAFAPQGAEALRSAIPPGSLERGGRGRTALSPAYVDALRAGTAVAVGVRLTSDEGSPFAVAELSLSPIASELKARSQGKAGRVDLVDGGGRVLASSGPGAPLEPLEPPLWAAVKANVEAARAGSFSVLLGTHRLVSAARVPGPLGLFAVVSVDEAAALAPVRAMRRTVLGSVGLSLAVLLALGWVFTRRINGRLRHVVEGVESFAHGELNRRIPVTGGDELTDLAQAFNAMGAELEGARTRLLQWNDELRQRVAEATAELKAAQAQLLEAQKLAAVGTLGAGVAHEINNPLAGILGNTQLLLLERTETDPDFATLRKIEQSAKRCKEITQNLLRFSQQAEKAHLRPIDLNAVVRDTFSLTLNQIRAEGISLTLELDPGPLMVRGDPGHLGQVLLALISNARTAMARSPGKQLTIASREDGEGVVLEVRDSGKGIAPEHLPRIFEPFFTTKDVWSNVGMGLSLAYRVVSEHQGKIDVESQVGVGTRFFVRLPKLKVGAAATNGRQAGLT